MITFNYKLLYFSSRSGLSPSRNASSIRRQIRISCSFSVSRGSFVMGMLAQVCSIKASGLCQLFGAFVCFPLYFKPCPNCSQKLAPETTLCNASPCSSLKTILHMLLNSTRPDLYSNSDLKAAESAFLSVGHFDGSREGLRQ